MQKNGPDWTDAEKQLYGDLQNKYQNSGHGTSQLEQRALNALADEFERKDKHGKSRQSSVEDVQRAVDSVLKDGVSAAQIAEAKMQSAEHYATKAQYGSENKNEATRTFIEHAKAANRVTSEFLEVEVPALTKLAENAGLKHDKRGR